LFVPRKAAEAELHAFEVRPWGHTEHGAHTDKVDHPNHLLSISAPTKGAFSEWRLHLKAASG
jgi:hypothetical protein